MAFNSSSKRVFSVSANAETLTIVRRIWILSLNWTFAERIKRIVSSSFIALANASCIADSKFDHRLRNSPTRAMQRVSGSSFAKSITANFCSRNPCLLCVSPPIRKALPGNALKRHGRALLVVDAKLLAAVVSEIEFGDIALKMLFTNMVESPDEATLQEGEKAFNGVGVRDAAHVFAGSVAHCVVRFEVQTGHCVAHGIIGHEAGFLRDMALQERLERLDVHLRDVERTHFALRSTSETTFILWCPPWRTFLPF